METKFRKNGKKSEKKWKIFPFIYGFMVSTIVFPSISYNTHFLEKLILKKIKVNGGRDFLKEKPAN